MNSARIQEVIDELKQIDVTMSQLSHNTKEIMIPEDLFESFIALNEELKMLKEMEYQMGNICLN